MRSCSKPPTATSRPSAKTSGCVRTCFGSRRSLTQYRELESTLKSALMSAHRTSDDMKSNAQAEAARIVREAEGQVELLMQRTQSQLEDVQREIDGMRLKRRESEVMLESIIAALQNTLEFVREQDQREGGCCDADEGGYTCVTNSKFSMQWDGKLALSSHCVYGAAFAFCILRELRDVRARSSPRRPRRVTGSRS